MAHRTEVNGTWWESVFFGQGFKGHQLHDVLSSPGSADLTADVDFSFLRMMAGSDVACLGPVTQRTFLKNMGIDSRMQVRLTGWQVLQRKLSITGSIIATTIDVIYFQSVETGGNAKYELMWESVCDWQLKVWWQRTKVVLLPGLAPGDPEPNVSQLIGPLTLAGWINEQAGIV